MPPLTHNLSHNWAQEELSLLFVFDVPPAVFTCTCDMATLLGQLRVCRFDKGLGTLMQTKSPLCWQVRRGRQVTSISQLPHKGLFSILTKTNFNCMQPRIVLDIHDRQISNGDLQSNESTVSSNVHMRVNSIHQNCFNGGLGQQTHAENS